MVKLRNFNVQVVVILVDAQVQHKAKLILVPIRRSLREMVRLFNRHFIVNQPRELRARAACLELKQHRFINAPAWGKFGDAIKRPAEVPHCIANAVLLELKTLNLCAGNVGTVIAAGDQTKDGNCGFFVAFNLAIELVTFAFGMVIKRVAVVIFKPNLKADAFKPFNEAGFFAVAAIKQPLLAAVCWLALAPTENVPKIALAGAADQRRA